MAVIVKASVSSIDWVKIKPADKVAVVGIHLVAAHISKLSLCYSSCSLCMIKLRLQRILKVNAAVVSYGDILDSETAAVKPEHCVVSVRAV